MGDDARELLEPLVLLSEPVLALAREGQDATEMGRVSLAEAAEQCWRGVETGDATLRIETDRIVSADENRLRQILENLVRNAVEHGSTSPPSQAREDSVEHGSTSNRAKPDDAVEHGARRAPARDARGDSVEHSSTGSRPEADDSLEHSSTGGRVGSDEGDGVTITVGDVEGGFYLEDDGPGIPGADRERVFEAGYSTSDGGTGFGLKIVADAARSQGWDVATTEGTDGGARFEVTGVEFIEG